MDLLQRSPGFYYGSALSLSGSPGFTTFFFVVAALAALGLTLGFKTRLSSWLTWFTQISIQNRFSAANYGADAVIACILLIGCFLDWGRSLSLDSRKKSVNESPIEDWGHVLLTQAFLIYFVAFVFKLRAPAWRDGNALSLILNHSTQLVRPLGQALARYPLACRLLQYVTLFIEGAVPFLLFAGTRPRLFAIAILVSFHLGISTSLSLGWFPWVCSALLIGLIPPKSPQQTGKKPPLSYALLAFMIFEALGPILQRDVGTFGAVLGFAQEWGMFSSRMQDDFGKPSLTATLPDGKRESLNDAEWAGITERTTPARLETFFRMILTNQNGTIQTLITHYLERACTHLPEGSTVALSAMELAGERNVAQLQCASLKQ